MLEDGCSIINTRGRPRTARVATLKAVKPAHHRGPPARICRHGQFDARNSWNGTPEPNDDDTRCMVPPFSWRATTTGNALLGFVEGKNYTPEGRVANPQNVMIARHVRKALTTTDWRETQRCPKVAARRSRRGPRPSPPADLSHRKAEREAAKAAAELHRIQEQKENQKAVMEMFYKSPERTPTN